jgi:hypothetical protein
MRRDCSRQLNTGTFISGYRSLLFSGYDTKLTKIIALLAKFNIKFKLGFNGELGGTAI